MARLSWLTYRHFIHKCLQSLTFYRKGMFPFRFAKYRFFISFRSISFRKVQIFHFVSSHFVSQSTDFSFRFVPFRFVPFRFVPFRFAKYNKPILPSSIKQQHIIFRPLRKIPLPQRQISLVLPHSNFRYFSYHEKSFSRYSKKNLQFQEESDEESTRANLQPSRASCTSWLQIAQSKLPIKIPTLRRKLPKLCGKEHPLWL